VLPERPAAPERGLVLRFPEDVGRGGRRLAVLRRRLKPHRQRIEEQIIEALETLEDIRQELIAKLDFLHGDPDLEPSFGGGGSLRYGCTDDRELDPADDPRGELNDADGEPELGASEDGHGGSRWNGHYWTYSGCEEDSLGWSAEINQRQLTTGSKGLEDACEDEGAQCDDEGWEW